MKLFANKYIKYFFCAVFLTLIIFFCLAEILVLKNPQNIAIWIPVIFLAMTICIFTICFYYFKKQNNTIEKAVSCMEDYLDGNTNARIACEEEGELYHLFHAINTLASVLNAHATKELQEKEFLKNTISDISHQLKTPLAALNIYNGLLQDESETYPAIKEFVDLSEQELDRIDTLVQNLLKITRLDAGTILFEKSEENLSDLMKDIQLHFSYRAKQENKEFLLDGDEKLTLFCDRDWMMEALNNMIKNAFDHTKAGNSISITWKQFASIIQIKIKDNGCGIHPEDLNYIFKRFYRSRFSKDTQGIGLGLPLAKAIIEAHNGSIEVDSELGIGTTFIINFLIPA